MPNPTCDPLVQANKLCILCKVCKVKRVPEAMLKWRVRCCYSCANKRTTHNRKLRWANGERPKCKNHPDKTVSRSAWLGNKRLCCKCNNARPAIIRAYKKRQQTPEYKEYQKWYHRSWRRARWIRENRL